MMPYLFDTDDHSDLTDAHIQEMLEVSGTLWKVAQIRRYPEEYAAEIALARLMRDHPELFEKLVDPIEKIASDLASDWGFSKDGEFFLSCCKALKKVAELAKGGEA